MNTAEQTKYVDIYLTDFQVHAQKMTNPAPLLRAVEKTIKAGKPSGRAYGKIDRVGEKDFTVHFSIPLDDKTQARVKEAQRLGKQIRILIPKHGLPILPGKDAIEKITALNRQKDKRFDNLLRR